MLDDSASRDTMNTSQNAPEASAGALTVAPNELRVEPRRTRKSSRNSSRREPTLEKNALSADAIESREAERVAFAMWREGRTDDAIAFLEREILLEKDRLWKRDAFSGRQEPHFGEPAPKVIVTPPPPVESKPKRRRKRSPEDTPVSEPVFSDASAPLIELAAETVAIAPDLAETSLGLAGRIGRGPAIVAALGLVIVGFAAAGNFWDNYRSGVVVERAAPALATEAPASATQAPCVGDAGSLPQRRRAPPGRQTRIAARRPWRRRRASARAEPGAQPRRSSRSRL